MFQVKKQLKNLWIARKLYLYYYRYIGNARNWLFSCDYKIKRSEILKISTRFSMTGIFIETGSFLGDTVDFMSQHFKLVHSIELSSDLANRCTKRFIGKENIQIHEGNSSEILPVLLQTITEPCLFWLDGHYSSEFYVGDEYIMTAHGDNITPILAEIKTIINHPIKKHIILIDDARLFTGRGGYPRIKEIRKLILKSGYSLESIKKDIIRILPL